MSATPTDQFQLEIAVKFLLLHEDPLRSATKISADPEMARRVIIAMATALADSRNRAKSRLITDRPTTVKELDHALQRACAWAIELTDEVQP